MRYQQTADTVVTMMHRGVAIGYPDLCLLNRRACVANDYQCVRPQVTSHRQADVLHLSSDKELCTVQALQATHLQ